MSALPVANPEIERNRPRMVVTGEVPSALRPKSGCRFHPRCAMAMDVCRSVDPVRNDMGEARSVACHLHGQPLTLKRNAIPRP